MTDLTRFRQYKGIADYEMQYGALPLDEILATTSSGKPNDQQAELVAKGMEIMVGMMGMMGNVMQGFDEKVSH